MKPKIIPIFPTPLYANIVPSDIINPLKPLFDQEPIFSSNDEESEANFGLRSSDSYMLNNPKYSSLKNYVLDQATNYADNILAYNYINYRFSQSWISYKPPHKRHIPHKHQHSFISGVIFYENKIPNMSNLFFVRGDNYSEDRLSHKIKNINPPHIPMEFQVEYTTNLMILFPSYLSHGVGTNTTELTRKSLAFNIVPRDGYGNEYSLNELKF